MAIILLIDDDPGLVEALMLYFSRNGHNSLAANSGREGVRLAQEAHPDIIICDLMMPDMDGEAVYQTLQEGHETSRIPFILLTGISDRELLNVPHYLVKPVHATRLLEMITKLLEE